MIEIEYTKTCGCCQGHATFFNEEEIEETFEAMGLTTSGNSREITECDTFKGYEII